MLSAAAKILALTHLLQIARKIRNPVKTCNWLQIIAKNKALYTILTLLTAVTLVTIAYFTGSGFEETPLDIIMLGWGIFTIVRIVVNQFIPDDDLLEGPGLFKQPYLALQLSYKDLQAFGSREFVRGVQTVVETKEDWPFVLKRFRRDLLFGSGISAEVDTQSYGIAQQRLGGLVEDFVFVDLTDERGEQEITVIMRKIATQNLMAEIIEAAKGGRIDLAEGMIKEYVDLYFRILKRDVFILDPFSKNFATTANGQTLLDPGCIRELYNEEILRLFYTAVRIEHATLIVKTGSHELAEFYLRTLEEYGLDEPNIRRTLRNNFGSDPSVEVPDISDEIAESADFLKQSSAPPPATPAEGAAAAPTELIAFLRSHVNLVIAFSIILSIGFAVLANFSFPAILGFRPYVNTMIYFGIAELLPQTFSILKGEQKGLDYKLKNSLVIFSRRPTHVLRSNIKPLKNNIMKNIKTMFSQII